MYTSEFPIDGTPDVYVCILCIQFMYLSQLQFIAIVTNGDGLIIFSFVPTGTERRLTACTRPTYRTTPTICIS